MLVTMVDGSGTASIEKLSKIAEAAGTSVMAVSVMGRWIVRATSCLDAPQFQVQMPTGGVMSAARCRPGRSTTHDERYTAWWDAPLTSLLWNHREGTTVAESPAGTGASESYLR